MSATATVLAGLLLILAGIVVYAAVLEWLDGREAREAERVADRAARNADHSAAFRAWNDEDDEPEPEHLLPKWARDEVARQMNDERETKWGG